MTVHIDPDAGAGGDGAIATPFDSWTDISPFVNGTTYLQQGGTTDTRTSQLNVTSTTTTLGSYGSGRATLSGGSLTDAKTIRVDAAATGLTITGLNVIGSTAGTGHGIQQSTGATGMSVIDCNFTGQAIATGKAMDIRNENIVVRNFTASNWQTGVSFLLAGTETGFLTVVGAHISGGTADAGGDCVQFITNVIATVGVGVKHGHFSGFAENGVDLVVCVGAELSDSDIGTPNASAPDNATGVFMGGSDAGRENEIKRCLIHDIDTTLGAAINTRGGYNGLVEGVVSYGCLRGIVFANAGGSTIDSDGNEIAHCTVIASTNSAIDSQVGVTNRARNCIFGGTPSIDVDATFTFLGVNNGLIDATGGAGTYSSSGDLTSLTPEFIDQAGGDLRLNGGSPCIGAGSKYWAFGSQPNGYDGLRFPLRSAAGPDIGAYAVRPGEDGATRKATAIAVSVLEAGVDIAKAKAA